MWVREPLKLRVPLLILLITTGGRTLHSAKALDQAINAVKVRVDTG